MGYECNKVCPYYEGALDVSRPRSKNGGYMRYVYKVQCCGKSLPLLNIIGETVVVTAIAAAPNLRL